MENRKKLKEKARGNLKRHYWYFVGVFLVLAMIGALYSDSTSIFESESSKVVSTSTGSGNATMMGMFYNLFQSGSVKDFLSLVQKSFNNDEDISIHEMAKGAQGIVSAVINSTETGSIYLAVFHSLKNLIKAKNIVSVLGIFACIVFELFLGLFVYENIQINVRRVLLEGRLYDKVSSQRLLFLFRMKRGLSGAITLILKNLLLMIWSFTIVGGIYKAYSYMLVPYILAENPTVKPFEAIRLSANMMKGYKWKWFLMDLSVLGWKVLGILTFGVGTALIANPYCAAIETEYYVEIRRLAILNKLPGVQVLCDQYLYEYAVDAELAAAYADVLIEMNEKEQEVVKLTGIRRFLQKWFGILLTYSGINREFEEQYEHQNHIKKWKDALDKKAYPGRLYLIPETQKNRLFETIQYQRNYSLSSLIMIFFLIASVGWVYEVSLHVIEDGMFVNRGVLTGPWLPIYGFGSWGMLICLKKFRANPVVQFLTIVCLCGVMEYCTAWYLDVVHHKKWWDYTGYFLNIHGRVCAEGLLVFGIGGIILVYLVVPVLDNYIRILPKKILLLLCTVMVIVFSLDMINAQTHPNVGSGVTNYKSLLNQGLSNPK